MYDVADIDAVFQALKARWPAMGWHKVTRRGSLGIETRKTVTPALFGEPAYRLRIIAGIESGTVDSYPLRDDSCNHRGIRSYECWAEPVKVFHVVAYWAMGKNFYTG